MGESMKAVFDTNILIDYLNGIEAAKQELDRYATRLISIITFIEVMAGAGEPAEERAVRGFLGAYQVIDLSAEIARETIALRKSHRLKIPDAVVYATARIQGCNLVSRNMKDFKPDWPDVRVPYRV
jgi:predicted nucleic acid-binding protein